MVLTDSKKLLTLVFDISSAICLLDNGQKLRLTIDARNVNFIFEQFTCFHAIVVCAIS